jgi:eukaryotic-like serine/threonine-protein kinase
MASVATFEDVLAKQQQAFQDEKPVPPELLLGLLDITVDSSQVWQVVEQDILFRVRTNRAVSVEQYQKQFPSIQEQIETCIRTEMERKKQASDAESSKPERTTDATKTFGSKGDSGSSFGAGSKVNLPGGQKGLKEGSEFGPYEILGILGKGGMGVVYKARHRETDQIVALKVVGGAAGKTTKALDRFQREVKAAERLQHPNIVGALDAGMVEGAPYLALEFIDGKDLTQVVKERGPLAPEVAVRYLLDAAKGLLYAHSRAVIHRDIKPSNLLLDMTTETVKVLDLGLAKVEELLDESSRGMDLTSTGAMFGTVDYMPPEQSRDAKRADERADIYSLGCTLHYLLTRKPVYAAETMLQKLHQHNSAPIPSLCQLVQGVPIRLDALFQSMLAKDPYNRPQSMQVVIEQLEQTLETLSGNLPDLESLPETVIRPSTLDQTETFVSTTPVVKKSTKAKLPWIIGTVALVVIVAVGVVVSLPKNVPVEKGDPETPAAIVPQPPEVTEATEQKEATLVFAPPYQEWSWPKDFPAPAKALFSSDEAKKFQESWAAKLKVPMVEDVANGLKLALIPPGEFDMGCPGDIFGFGSPGNDWANSQIDSSRPIHPVRLTRPFQMSVHEITIAQFSKFVEATGYKTTAELDGKGGNGFKSDGTWAVDPKNTWRRAGTDPNEPVVYVSRRDAEAYCGWLTKQDKRTYRLPTEAEWEYAAQAGSQLSFGVASTTAELQEFAWVGESQIQPPEKRRQSPYPIGKKKPNAFGLHDMLGNVWEICADQHVANYYSNSPRDNPVNQGNGQAAIRGGGFVEGAATANPAVRGPQANAMVHTGFRVVREFPGLSELNPVVPHLVSPGDSLGARATVSRPGAIPGLRSWSIETINFRGSINSISYSPKNGLIAAAAQWDPVIRIYNEKLGLIKVFPGHAGSNTILQWSPDGKFLASASWGSSWDNSIKVWQVDTGRILFEVKPGSWVHSIHWSPDSCEIAAACGGLGLRVFDLRTERVRMTPPLNHTSWVSWSPDGRFVSTIDNRNMLTIYDADTLQLLHDLPAITGAWQALAEWSPDSSKLAIYQNNGEVVFLDTKDFKGKAAFKLDYGPNSLLWTPDGKKLTVGGAKVTTWDLSTMKQTDSFAGGLVEWFKPSESVVIGRTDGLLEIRTIAGLPVAKSADRARPRSVTAMLSPDGKQLATRAGTDLLFWNAEDGQHLQTHAQVVVDNSAIAWSPTGDRLASWSDKNLFLIDRETAKQKINCTGHNAAITAVSWSKDGQRLVSTGGDDKSCRIWSSSDGKNIEVIDIGDPTYDAAWSRKGDLLAVASNKEVRLYSSDGKTLKTKLPLPGEFKWTNGQHGLSWSHDDKRLICPAYGGVIFVVDIESMKTNPITSNLGVGLWGVTHWSPDGQRIIATADYNDGYVYEPEQRKTSLFFPLRFAGWHPDSRRLVSGNSSELEMYGFDTKAGKRLGSLLPFTGTGNPSLCVSPDGHFRGPANAVVVAVQTENGEHFTFAPAEFEKKYGWKNDPNKASLLKLPPDPPELNAISPTPQSPRTLADPKKFEPLDNPTLKSIDLTPNSPAQLFSIPDALVVRPPSLNGLQSWTIETAGQRGQVKMIAESPTGKLVATGSESGEVRLWDDRLRLQRILLGAQGMIHVIAWSRDGRYLAVGGEDTIVRIWEAGSGKLLREVPVRYQAFGISWSPSAKQLLVSTPGGWGVIDTLNGIYDERETGSFQSSLYADWSPDGSEFAIGSGFTIQIWETSRLLRVREIIIPPDVTGIISVVWSPNGKQIAVNWGENGTRVGFSDPEKGSYLGDCSRGTVINRLTWTKDSTRVMGGWGRGYIWDATSRQIVATTPSSNGPTAISADGKSVIVCGSGYSLARCDLYTGQVLSGCSPEGWPPGHRLIAAAPNASPIVTYPSAHLRRWNVESGQLEIDVGVPDWGGPYPSPDGNEVILHTAGTVQIVPMKLDGKPRFIETGKAVIEKIAWSPDSKRFATTDSEFVVRIWDAATSKPIHRLTGHTQPIHVLAWSSDGARLATASAGDQAHVRIWDTNLGKEIQHLVKCPVTGMTWTPDSKLLTILRPSGEVVNANPSTGKISEPILRGIINPIGLAWADDQKWLAVDTNYSVQLIEIDSHRRKTLPGVRLISGDPKRKRILVSDYCKIRGYSVENHRWLGTLYSQLQDFRRATISPDGHMRGSDGYESDFVYVGISPDGRQETFTPDAFRKIFGWVNEPNKAKLADTNGEPAPSLAPPIAASSLDTPDRIASESILCMGGAVWIRDSQGPFRQIYKVEEIPNEPFELVGVYIGLADLQDEDFKILNGLRGLKSLGVVNAPKLTDKLLLMIGDHPFLRNLSLGNLSVTDIGIAQVTRFSGLESLDLNGLKVTDKSAAILAQLKNLKSVNLQNTTITDATVFGLSGLPRLESIYLTGYKITDQSGEALGKIPTVRNLDLQGTAITDKGVREIVKLPRLEQLVLFGEGVTGTGFATITSPLRYLGLQGSKVAPTSLDSLGRVSTLTRLVIPSKIFTRTVATSIGNLPKLSDMQIQPPVANEFNDIALLKEIKTLYLYGADKLTGADYKSISQMPKLESLQIYQGEITPVILAEIAKCKTLKSLKLQTVVTSQTAINQFKTARPDCPIDAFDNSQVK